MMPVRSCSALALLVLAALACSSSSTRRAPAPAPSPGAARVEGPSTAATLGIPPGHLPRVGQCRVWIEGRPPGQQARAGDCKTVMATAPAGSWILYRPGEDRRVVHVRIVDERRPGVVVRVRVFEVETGKFLREER